MAAAKLTHADEYKNEPGATGVGLCFGPPYFGVDLDKCIDPETGTVEPWAADIISQVPATYTELSPSGKGFHLWYRTDKHSDLLDGVRTDKAEVYARGRYFTVTGNHYPGTPLEVTDVAVAQAKKIFALIESLKSKKQVSEVIEPASSAKLETLLSTSDFPDLSSAVQSLLWQLFYKYGTDARDKVEEIFKTSKLYTDTHWVTKWARLRENELDLAVGKVRQWVQDHPKRSVAKKANRVLVVRSAQSYKPEHQHYFFKPYLPIGQLVHFGGDQGQGKSPVVIDLLAQLTAPHLRHWPDGQPNINDPLGVLLLSMEDDPAAITLPRFDLAGGDRGMLQIVEGTKLDEDSTHAERTLALDEDMHLLTQFARKMPHLGAVGIDPTTNYLGRVKMNAESEVRTILTPLSHLAQELKIVVISIGHFNRREKGTSALNRVMGAQAFTGVARQVVLFGPDPDTEEAYHHVMTTGRGELQVGLKYKTTVVERTWDNETSDVVKIAWGEKTKANADEVAEPESRAEKSKTAEASRLLTEILKSGKKQATECLAMLKDAGLDEATLKNIDRVRKKAGVKSEKVGKGWEWSLSTSQMEF